MLTSRAWVEIDLEALRANVGSLRAYLGPETRLMAVVKADAYGHGLLPVAWTVEEAGAAWLGVASVSEGVTLREAGLRLPIALLCPPAPAEAETLLASRITALVGDRETLDALVAAARPALARGESPAIHLEIDTGIGRSGLLPEQAVTFWRAATDAGLRVTGLATHYADAENSLSDLTQWQAIRFERTLEALTAAGAVFDLIHSNNSAAALHPRTRQCPGSLENMARPGLLLYGLLPAILNVTTGLPDPLDTAQLPPLRPVLSLKARVATVRDLPAGHPISYGATYTLTRPSRVATVLIGYGDGYPRRLSNRGSVLLRGRRAPILGRVCMDQTVVDVTDIPGVLPGDVAVCIGTQGTARISAEEIAVLIETTEHEITTCLTARLPRLLL